MNVNKEDYLAVNAEKLELPNSEQALEFKQYYEK